MDYKARSLFTLGLILLVTVLWAEEVQFCFFCKLSEWDRPSKIALKSNGQLINEGVSSYHKQSAGPVVLEQTNLWQASSGTWWGSIAYTSSQQLSNTMATAVSVMRLGLADTTNFWVGYTNWDAGLRYLGLVVSNKENLAVTP